MSQTHASEHPDRPVSRYRKTKIVATVGPASRSPDRVRQLITAGVNVFRLNFSHGSHEEHLQSLTTIRTVAGELGTPTAVLQDLSGPKIRISNVEGDYVQIEDNAEILLRHAKGGTKSDDSVISVEGLDPAGVLEPGQSVLLSDGMIVLTAEEVTHDSVRCTVVKGGRLRSRVGIAFPDSAVDLPATTEKDFHDLRWGIKNGVDYVAISFVQNARDVQMLRDVVHNEGGDVRIIAKIERKRALTNIEEIMSVSDGLMVARGDLGLEVPLEQLPRLQRKLIEGANYRGIPVIVATQMLHSMITAVRPTRAEVSDIAVAVSSGADAVMLSEETAIGENPVEAVRYLSLIAKEAEKTFDFEEYKQRLHDVYRESIPDAVAYASGAAAVKLDASAVISCTETGSSARLVAKYRPQVPHYAATWREDTLRRMSLCWGVIPLFVEKTSDHFAEIDNAIKAVKERASLSAGSRVVVIGGVSVAAPGSTSIMEIKEIEG